MTRTLEARTLGCLLGGAVGDALGTPVEGMTRRQIRDRIQVARGGLYADVGVEFAMPRRGGVRNVGVLDREHQEER
ncbi:MAG: ADP-ribosylglycohydrolase family protein, partial [Nitrospinota bacterium]